METSTKNTHTPGPWHIIHEPTLNTYHIRVEDLDAAPVASLFYSSGGSRPQLSRELIDANARLIAAAPDLLRYAQIVEEWESCRTKESQYDFTKRHGVENVRNVDLWLSYLRKDVIGKATAK